MSHADADRNLLFGVLALQSDAISRAHFIDACTLWASQKERPLADLLVERGWLLPADRADVERLVARKLGKHAGDARAGLAEATGDVVQKSLAEIKDPEVRRSIGLPDSPPAGHVLVSTMAYQPGSRDRYTLTRLHAKGGLGQVWLARDQALRRDVALKELRPERAPNPAVWARFLEEARITGQLEHPNIVTVHELAEPTENRQPFYTMRFVKGRTLSDASRTYHARRVEGAVGPLELRDLLQAFVGVCQAIAYAHSRGVLHRDLKGQNVVLGDFGEVIVLDWGLAKVVGQTEETITPGLAVEHSEARGETMQGQALGTPAYMSPEQAEGRWDAVDRRTDVYGLGAILYEILSGNAPFDGMNTAEVLRQVAQEPPKRPSTIWDSVPKALEAVCLKALAKAPDHRYPTADSLADEVKHWMADEPVTAYREPFAVRAGRWGRRHRSLVAAASVLMIASLVGLSTGTVLLSQANARTDAQRRVADQLRIEAQANFQKARQAVDEYFTKVSESKLLNVPGLQPLRKELLESSRKYYQGFLKDHANDSSVRAETAEAWYRVGFVTKDVDTPRQALDPLQKSADLYDQLARDDPSVEKYAYKLAMCLNDLGNQQSALGLEPEAAKSHERCLAIRQQLVGDHPNVPEYRKELGIGYMVWADRQYHAGLTAESMASSEKSRDVLEQLVREYPNVADYRFRLCGALGYIGWGKVRAGRPDEAMSSYRKQLALAEELVREQPLVLDYKTTLAYCHAGIGWVHYRVTGRNEDALQALLKAQEIAENIAGANPDVTSARVNVAGLDHEIGRVLVRLKRPEEALVHYRKTLELEEARAQSEPSVWVQRELGYLHFELGKLHASAGRTDAGVKSLERARSIFESLADSKALDPYNRACAQAICADLVGIGKAALSAEEWTQRQKFSTQSVATLREALAGGHHSAAMISSDDDFEAIRSSDEFQALLTELKAKALAQGAPDLSDNAARSSTLPAIGSQSNRQ